jgi:hypothetical protein
MPPNHNKDDKHVEPERSQPRNDNPVSFFNHYKTYVNGWIAVAVLLPAGITWKGMPIYEDQRGLLTTYTGLSCVLILAFLFSSRDLLPKLKTRIGAVASLLIPLILICTTGFCGYKYVVLLTESAYYAQKPLTDALNTVSLGDIHGGTSIIAYYIMTMVFAEVALFFMAFREWRP